MGRRSIVIISILLLALANLNLLGKGPEGTNLTNPIAATPASIQAGKAVYEVNCASCHGTTGKGDGPMAAQLPNPKPSNLADGNWEHGSTDGEIFVAIRDGIPDTTMRAHQGRLTDEDMWNVVNFIRSIGPR